jgi:hypothetical protein
VATVWTINFKQNDVNIYFSGDIHLGSKQSDKDTWIESIETIADDPIGFHFGMGDAIDSIIAKDKRYDPFNKDPDFETIDDAFTFFEDHYKIIKDKSGGLLVGNHEWVLINQCEMNETRKICQRLAIPYLGFSSLIQLVFPNRKVLCGFIAHGSGGGRKPGSKLNRLDEVKGKFNDLDFAAFGHTHDLVARPIVTLQQRGSDITSKIIHTASTGSFLRNYVPDTIGYGERALYDPLPVGYVTLPIRDGEIYEGFRYTIMH